MNVENLLDKLDKADNMTKLSNAFDEISKALDKTCKSVSQSIFDYRFSTFLYYQYIVLNKTKREIAKNMNIHESTIFYYIQKYKLKKDPKTRQLKMLETMKKTCNKKYGVDHPGELIKAHEKRIENILNKTNGNYSKSFYQGLRRSEKTISKMKIAQQYRRHREKEGEDIG